MMCSGNAVSFHRQWFDSILNCVRKKTGLNVSADCDKGEFDWRAFGRFLYRFVFNLVHAYRFHAKQLDKFFKKLDNPEINRQFTYPLSFKDIENKQGNKILPPDFVFTSERPHYSLALFSSFICTCTTLAKT